MGVRLGGQELGVQVGGFAAVAWRAAELRAVEPSAGAVPERDQHGRVVTASPSCGYHLAGRQESASANAITVPFSIIVSRAGRSRSR